MNYDLLKKLSSSKCFCSSNPNNETIRMTLFLTVLIFDIQSNIFEFRSINISVKLAAVNKQPLKMSFKE